MWLASALLALAAAVGGQFVLARLRPGGPFVVRFLAVGGVIGLVLAGQLMHRHGAGAEFWAGVLVYGFACELYLFLVTLVGSSASASLLRILRYGSATRAVIDGLSSGQAMVVSRLETLCVNGLLSRVSDGYALTRRGRCLLIPFRVLRLFFHGRRLPASGAP